MRSGLMRSFDRKTLFHLKNGLVVVKMLTKLSNAVELAFENGPFSCQFRFFVFFSNGYRIQINFVEVMAHRKGIAARKCILTISR